MEEKFEFSIRKMAIDDLNEVLSIEKEAIASSWSAAQIEFELLKNPFGCFKVAVDETNEHRNSIIGFIIYWITFDSATIAQIVVKNDYRRRGIARGLLEEMIQNCRDKHVKTITLEVRTNNQPALNLYESYGFKKVTIKEKYYQDGSDAIYMVREVY